MISSYGLRGTEEFNTGERSDVKQRMKEIYNETASITQSRWVQQSIDSRFYAGDQSLWGELYSQIPSFQKKQFNFNKIKRLINMVAGYQRSHRKALNIIPIEGSDQRTADQLSKLLIWANQREDAYLTISNAFLGSLVTGMNLVSLWMDYREDQFSGDLKIENMGYNGYLIDPYFKKLDLSDCNYVWTRNFLSKEVLISLMPKRKDDILSMNNYGSKDGYFNFLPENYMMTNKNLLPMDEFWYLDYRPATVLIDKINEVSLEWKGKKENLDFYLKAFPQLEKKTIQKKTVRLCVCVNNQVMYDGLNPYKIDRYPFVPVVAYYQPDLPYYEWRIQGMVRGLRDPQFILNRRQAILLDVLESQVNSGLKVMEGSFVDDKDAFKSGQGQTWWIKSTSPAGMDSVQKIPSADVSPAFMQVIEQMDKSLMDISGINEELLGSAEDDKAGILSMLRQGAGLTTLQILFDNLDTSLKNIGEIEVALIQANFTEYKVGRILGEPASEEFKDKSFQKYDCEVVEGSDTPTQKMLAFKQKLYLREIGIPIPTEDLLQEATFQNKNETIQKIVQQEQMQQQIQQMQMQLELQELQARTNLANARASADEGLAVERTSRVAENQALATERRAAAIKDLELANLDKIKAAKELFGIDLNQLQQVIDIVNSLQQKEEEKAEELTPTQGNV